MKQALLLIALILVVSPALANDTTYYVDRLLPGSDSNNGTSVTTPWLTISHCVAVATSPGDRCRVKNGTYPEYVQMGASGTSGHPITIENYPGHSPKIQPTSHNLQGIQLLASGAYPGTNGIQYVTIDGLEITGAGYDGIKINSGSHIVMKNNYIHDNGGWDATGTINGNGILSVGCYQCTIDKNRIYHNGCFACPKAHGLYLYGSGWTVTNNLIYDNARYGIQTSSHAFDSANMASAVSGLAGWANGLIANNTIAYNRDRAGIVIWNAGSGVSLMSGIVVENNILYENGATSSDNSTAQGIDFLSVSGLTLTVNNNISYGSGTGSTVFTSGSSGVTVTSLSTNCPTTVGGNCGTRPTMTNAPATVPTSPDFHLSTGSSALGFGANLTSSFTTDFSGTTRSATGPWSVGAYAPTGSSGGGGGSGGGTNTTTILATDTFNRAAEDPLTATNWVLDSAAGHPFLIPSNMASIAQPKLFSGGDAMMGYTSVTPNPDQYAKVTLAGVSGTNTDKTVGQGPCVRTTSGAKTGVCLVVGAFGWELRRDTTGTKLSLSTGATPTFALGDSAELRVHGNPPIFEAIKSGGTPFATITDSSAGAFQSGLCGMFYSSTDTGQTPGSSTHGIDYFECGNYAFGADTTAPGVPTALAATANLPNQLLLTWTAPTDNVAVTSYNVQRCTPSPCTPSVTIAAPTTTSFSDTGLADATGYSYRVDAFDAAGNQGVFSSVVSTTTQTVDAPTISNCNPSGTAVSDAASIVINCTTSIPATVKYNTRTQGTAAYASLQQTMTVSGLVASATVTPDQHGSNSGVNHFYIAADNAANPGHTSSTADMTFTMITPVDVTSPSTISDLSLAALDTVRLQATWSAATDGVGVTGYLLSGCAGVGCTSYNITLNAAPGTTSAILALDASTTYNFIIQAYDVAGNNAVASNVASSATYLSTAPEDMASLAVAATRKRSVVLSWTAPLVEASTALIEQCTPKTSATTCSGTWAQVASIPLGNVPSIGGLTPNTSYCWRGKLGNSQNGVSANASNIICTTTTSTGLEMDRQRALLPRQQAAPR